MSSDTGQMPRKDEDRAGLIEWGLTRRPVSACGHKSSVPAYRLATVFPICLTVIRIGSTHATQLNKKFSRHQVALP